MMEERIRLWMRDDAIRRADARQIDLAKEHGLTQPRVAQIRARPDDVHRAEAVALGIDPDGPQPPAPTAPPAAPPTYAATAPPPTYAATAAPPPVEEPAGRRGRRRIGRGEAAPRNVPWILRGDPNSGCTRVCCRPGQPAPVEWPKWEIGISVREPQLLFAVPCEQCGYRATRRIGLGIPTTSHAFCTLTCQEDWCLDNGVMTYANLDARRARRAEREEELREEVDAAVAELLKAGSLIKSSDGRMYAPARL